jgi:hypothetical protein
MAKEVTTGINKVGDNFYRTKVTDNGDGTFGSTLFRTDAQGNNGVPIAGYAADQDGAVRVINTTNATVEEQRLLSDTNSQLNQVRREQVRSTENEFFGSPANQSTLDQVGGGSGNQTDVDPNNPGAAGGSTPTNSNQEITEQTTAITDFKYPEKLSLDQDVIQFQAVRYIPTGLDEQNQSTSTREKNKNRTIEGTVTLPIQAQITDSNMVGWGEGALDEITRKALNTAANLADGSINEETFGKNLQSTIKDFTSDPNQTLALIAEKVIGLQNIQGRTGGILNPNVELLFNGPQLRPFSFTFRMTPRTKKESEIARGIIKFFKKNMAVKRDNGLFLKAPNTFLIKYMGKNDNEEGANEKKALNKIKECALISFDVNYTPQGTYMTFDDGSMVSYLISLSFKELVPIYYEDYEDDHPIGF